MPRVGARARVAHFGGGFEAAVVVVVEDEGRRLQVRCEGGEVVEFALSPATARFVAAGSSHGARLELLD
jgi:phage gp45-like